MGISSSRTFSVLASASTLGALSVTSSLVILSVPAGAISGAMGERENFPVDFSAELCIIVLESDLSRGLDPTTAIILAEGISLSFIFPILYTVATVPL